MVAQMLDALNIHDDHTVLELGTATGYTTALLCTRVGEGRVTSIEIDPVLSEQGRTNVAALGYEPRLVVGDGTLGHPAGAPYDRVLATVAAKHAPGAWVAQTRPGGIIVTPWGSDFGGHWLLRLVVGDDGAARGRIVGEAAFMWLRSQRSYTGTWSDHIDFDTPMAETTTALDPRVALTDEGSGHAFVLGVLVPDLYRIAAWPKTPDGKKDTSGKCTV